MQRCVTFYVLVTLLAIITITTKVNGHRHKFVGGRTQVKDVKTNQEIQDLGKFSVKEYNDMNLSSSSPLRDVIGRDGPLRFVEVVQAQKQVVSGIKYYLTVVAMQKGGETRTFDAVVVIKPWVRSKQLLNFGPSTQY